jgi:hypothetical protein
VKSGGRCEREKGEIDIAGLSGGYITMVILLHGLRTLTVNGQTAEPFR